MEPPQPQEEICPSKQPPVLGPIAPPSFVIKKVAIAQDDKIITNPITALRKIFLASSIFSSSPAELIQRYPA